MTLRRRILYHFKLFGMSRVTGPLDGTEIGVLSWVTLSLAGCDKVFAENSSLRYAQQKFKFAEIWPESHVTLASAEVNFQCSGHGSQAMLNNSKWYSTYIRKSQIFLRPLFGLINVWRLTLDLKCLLLSDICPFCLTFIYSKKSAIL